MNSLAKVPPYSKLNFEGQIFFNQNWCKNFMARFCFCLGFFLGGGFVKSFGPMIADHDLVKKI
jgi:hypothetical protein